MKFRLILFSLILAGAMGCANDPSERVANIDNNTEKMADEMEELQEKVRLLTAQLTLIAGSAGEMAGVAASAKELIVTMNTLMKTMAQKTPPAQTPDLCETLHEDSPSEIEACRTEAGLR